MKALNKLLLGAAVAIGGVAALGNSHEAMARTVIYADVEPPALRVETVPGPRPGYVWINGYWGWGGHAHVWHKGHWVHERHGYHWAPARWEHEGHRWRYYDGRWER